MKSIVYWSFNGEIKEWRDYKLFNYSEPQKGNLEKEITDSEYENRYFPAWYVEGGISSIEPVTPEIPLPSKEEISMLRAYAYAHPITGSDKLFSEVSRMKLNKEHGHVEILKKANQRYQEIKDNLPFN